MLTFYITTVFYLTLVIHHTAEYRAYVINSGACHVGACPTDAEIACKNFDNNTHTCLCTHDSLPPTADGTCPRNTVPIDSQNAGSGRIPNVSVQQSTSPPTNINAMYLAGYITGGVVISLTLLAVIILLRRRKNLHNAAASPINLKHSLLIAERYAPNPQYSSCPGAGVPLLNKETLKFISEIGEGCFGKVYKGELHVEGNDQAEIVAIKVLKESASPEAEDNFLREVEIMSAFRHPYILSLLGVVLREGNVNPMMVFEYMPHGDLAELLRTQKRSCIDNDVPLLSDRDLLAVALQIASGMRYLAAQRFVHRDLACRNCLVTTGPTVKIADFGMSRDVYTCDYYKIGGSRLLPVRWMSPESVVYGRFTLESDIWSYGVVLWEIYSFGKQPFYGHTNEEVVKLILDGIMLIPPEDCPSLICELMKNCWKTEPRDRIRFPNICDKLELAYENYIENPQATTVFPNEVNFINECKQEKTQSNIKSLPRPPPLPVFSEAEVLDTQGYLLPRQIKEPVQYLETLPD